MHPELLHVLKGLIFMKSRGHREDVLLTVYLAPSSYSWCFAFAEGASELAMNSDCICFDSLPSQYSATKSFFLFSANKPIPGHKLQNLSASERKKRTCTLCICECVCLVLGVNFPPGFGSGQPDAGSLRSSSKLTQQITCTLFSVKSKQTDVSCCNPDIAVMQSLEDPLVLEIRARQIIWTAFRHDATNKFAPWRYAVKKSSVLCSLNEEVFCLSPHLLHGWLPGQVVFIQGNTFYVWPLTLWPQCPVVFSIWAASGRRSPAVISKAYL